MKKILFLATYGDFLATFELSNITIAQELGFEVHCAANFSNQEYNRKTDRLKSKGIKLHEVDFSRTPFKLQNIEAYRKINKIIKNEKINVLDCHNAIVSAFARLAAKKSGIKNVLYTPHSFFFYKGCPKTNELIYKKVEEYFARYTDTLICINKEDYESALNMPIRGKALYVPGVGVDVNKIKNISMMRKKYCDEFNIPIDSFIMISVGELIERKNHILALRAFKEANIDKSYYLICGIGKLKDELKEEAKKLKIEDKVIFTGYRNDVIQIMKSSDLYVFPSFQEGLPVALMEAMACGLPCVASRIRGNVDLIDEKEGGFLFNPNNYIELANKIKIIVDDKEARSRFGKYNEEKIKEFDIKNVQAIMKLEYSTILKKGDMN